MGKICQQKAWCNVTGIPTHSGGLISQINVFASTSDIM